jgi:hypothetical protein
MTEYLVVKFPKPRKVLLNDNPLGNTNDLLPVDEGGKYTVSLEKPPYDFMPPEQEIDLHDTAPLNPLEVEFEET